MAVSHTGGKKREEVSRSFSCSMQRVSVWVQGDRRAVVVQMASRAEQKQLSAGQRGAVLSLLLAAPPHTACN